MGIGRIAALSFLAFSFSNSWAAPSLEKTPLHFPAIQPSTLPSSIGSCPITGVAPDLVSPWGIWKVKFIDMDGDFIVIHYQNTNAPTSRPGFFKNFIISWHKAAGLAPWIVYGGNENIQYPRISSLGHVAFRHTQAISPNNTFVEEQLVVCPLDFNRGLGQFDPYACGSDPTQRMLVEAKPYNQQLAGIPNSTTDGDLTSWDWSGDYLAYGHSSISQYSAFLSEWYLPTSTSNLLDSAPPRAAVSIASYNGGRAMGYSWLFASGTIFTPGFSIQTGYSASYPTGTALNQMINYHTETTVPGSYALFSTNANAFFFIGGEWHQVYGTRASATTYGNQLNYHSSANNYATTTAITPLSSTTTTYSHPVRTQFQGNEYLLFEARPQNGPARLDLYQYNSSYFFDRSITASSPFTGIFIRGVSDNVILALQSNGNASFDQYALLKCH